MTTPCVVVLDKDDPTVDTALDLDWPEDWVASVQPSGQSSGLRMRLSDLYNWQYEALAPQPFWGFLADDVVPETPGWDVRLAEVAAGDGLAAPAGAHPGATAPPHFVLGGELVDSIGWLALPGLSRLFIDTVWHDIATARGVLREVPDVVLRHRHFSNGLALYDETYWKPDKATDRALYKEWQRSRLVEAGVLT